MHLAQTPQRRPPNVGNLSCRYRGILIVVLQAVAKPEDVAEAVLSLLEGSRLVTGQTLVVDGGALIGVN